MLINRRQGMINTIADKGHRTTVSSLEACEFIPLPVSLRACDKGSKAKRENQAKNIGNALQMIHIGTEYSK